MNIYLSEQEREYIHNVSEMLGVSEAYIIRLILRHFIGLPIGGSGMSEITWLTETKSGHVQKLTGAR